MKLHDYLRVGYWAYMHGIPYIPGIVNKHIRRVYGCDIPSMMKIPRSVQFKHNALGVALNAGTSIGENVVIHQNVTIGKRITDGGCPIIEDDVYIGAGAIILGDIRIGKGAKIGAGAIILTDVPPYKTAVCDKAHVL